MTELQSSHSTVHLSSVVLRLRADLVFSVREYGGQMMYVVEDDLASRYYRLGPAEYTFVSFLDGHNTFASALGRTAAVMNEQALTEDEAAAFCRWLVESGLASTKQSAGTGRLLESAQLQKRALVKSALNPMFIRIPLFKPDQAARIAAASIGWIFSFPSFLIWLLVVIVGTLSVLSDWDEVRNMSSSVVSPNNWVWLAATWVLLKLVHEAAHAIACRRYGGTVREGGIMLLLLAPIPYVDVTSAWRFASRWQRVVTDVAGIYAELFLFGIAAMLWSNCEPGMMRQALFNVMVTSSVVTLLVNANPLMRFDGYFVLCDLLELPNLAAQGRSWMVATGKRIFFGMTPGLPAWPETRAWLVAGYGVAAFVWKLTVSVGLVLAADAMFYGAGVVVAAFAVMAWLVLPLFGLIRFLVFGGKTAQPNRVRFGFISVLLIAAVGGVLRAVPWHAKTESAVIVDYYPIITVRTPSGGFVEEVYVTSGDFIKAGTAVALLKNEEQSLEHRAIETELEQTLQRVRMLRQQKQLAAMSAEMTRAEALQERAGQLIRRNSERMIVAPADGVVLDGDVEALLGRYLEVGQTVCSLGAGQEKKVLAMISQNDLPRFQQKVDQTVSVHVWGSGSQSLNGRLTQPAPRGRTDVIHPAFAATNGGPLEVFVNPNPVENAGVDGESAPGIQLTTPHFLAEVKVEQSDLDALRSGQLGTAYFRTSVGSTGEVLRDSVTQWWLGHQEALRRQWQ